MKTNPENQSDSPVFGRSRWRAFQRANVKTKQHAGTNANSQISTATVLRAPAALERTAAITERLRGEPVSSCCPSWCVKGTQAFAPCGLRLLLLLLASCWLRLKLECILACTRLPSVAFSRFTKVCQQNFVGRFLTILTTRNVA